MERPGVHPAVREWLFPFTQAVSFPGTCPTRSLRLQPHIQPGAPHSFPSVGSAPLWPRSSWASRSPDVGPTACPPTGRLLFQVHDHSLIQLVPALCSQHCGRWVTLWFAEGQAWSSLHFLQQNPNATTCEASWKALAVGPSFSWGPPHPTHIPSATQCGRGPSPLISYAATQLCVSCYLDSREAGWASRPGLTGGPTSSSAESGGAPSSSPGGEGEPSGEVGPFLSSSLAASLAATARSVHPGEMNGRAPRPEVSDSPAFGSSAPPGSPLQRTAVAPRRPSTAAPGMGAKRPGPSSIQVPVCHFLPLRLLVAPSRPPACRAKAGLQPWLTCDRRAKQLRWTPVSCDITLVLKTSALAPLTSSHPL